LLTPFRGRQVPVIGFVNEGRDYEFVTLEQALADEVYRSPEGYIGP
jgi:hypothetical protein